MASLLADFRVVEKVEAHEVLELGSIHEALTAMAVEALFNVTKRETASPFASSHLNSGVYCPDIRKELANPQIIHFRFNMNSARTARSSIEIRECYTSSALPSFAY